MSWDLLCKFVEGKFLDGLIESPLQTFRETKVFVFDRNQLPSCQGNIKRDPNIFDSPEDFRLPFPKIAVQDQRGITFIMDLEKDQFGLETERFVISVDYEKGQREGMVIVGTAKDIFASHDNIQAVCSYQKVGAFDKGKILRVLDQEEIYQVYPLHEIMEMRETFLYRLIEILYLMKPKNFILEEHPKKRRESNMKIPRMHERPIFTILNPKEIRQKMGVDQPQNEGSPRTPHERSGHYRTLRHERSGDRVGERIWIKPTWIGTSEARVGNKFYKVRLDL